MRSRVLWIILIVVTALLVAAYIVGGRPRPVCQVGGSIVALQADDRGLVWLETAGAGPPPTLSISVLERGDRAPRCIHPERPIRSFALSADHVLVLESDGQRGSLLSVPRSGGQATTLAEGLLRPTSLLLEGTAAYWTETRPAAAPHVWHIPTLLPRAMVCSRPIQSQGAGQAIVAIEAQTDEFQGTLLGLHDGRLYWLDILAATNSDSWSTIRSVPTTGGLTETIARERGVRTALLEADTLYWTAPSEDAGDPLHCCCIRRAVLPQDSPVTLTDWVMAGGSLCRFRGQLYYGAVDGLWAVPDALGTARQVGKRVVTRGLVVGWSGAIYQVAIAPEGDILLRRPLSLGTRLKAAARVP